MDSRLPIRPEFLIADGDCLTTITADQRHFAAVSQALDELTATTSRLRRTHRIM
jgi:hypothetical protein